MRNRTPARRFTSRGARRHLVLAGFSFALVTCAAVVAPAGRRAFGISMATAYGGLVLLAGSLAIGPVNLLLRRANPLNNPKRRAAGVWAAVLGAVHSGAGLSVHMKGRFWEYFFTSDSGLLHLRTDGFGTANYAGLLAIIVLLLLVLVSNDAALRHFGAERWKRHQRVSYGAATLVVFHGTAYQLIERRSALLVASFASIAGLGLLLQLLGVREHRRQQEHT